MAREPLGFFPRLRTPQLPATHAREGTDHRARAWDHVIGIADLLTIHLQHATSCRTTEFIPFLDYDVEIRRVLCSTNAIESLNARYRRAIKARGHFPSEQAAMKCLYLVTRSLDPTGQGRARWAMRWKPALNAFSITFADRFPAAETY
jgi:transposase-like protein